MLVGVAFLPLISALWNIDILHHKKAKLCKHMRQSVYEVPTKPGPYREMSKLSIG